jgi:tetratricopeptide (TPR) repeat protein
MLLLRTASFLSLWVLLASGPPLGAQELPGQLGFAYDLMANGHWEQAIEEFRRFCYFHPEDPLVPKASFSIGRCYELVGRFGEAVEAYRRVASLYADDPAGREALFRVGEASYRAERFEEARIALDRFVIERPEDPWKWKARYRGAWASLHLHAFVLAREEFSFLASEENPYRRPAQQISGGIEEIKELPYRSPVMAGVLSALLPGSGQFYGGARKDGLLAFLVNGALIAASVGAWNQEVYGVAGLVSVVALTFYAGNIYGAINSAHLANQKRLEAHLRGYQSAYEWWESQ